MAIVVLDAQALIALFRNEPGAEDVETILRDGQAGISAINLAEVVDQLHRVGGVALAQIASVVSTLVPDRVRIIEVTGAHAHEAAAIRARRYQRSRSPLSMADCIALAVVGVDDRLATADGPLLRAAQAEGRHVIALRDSSGQRARVR